MVYIDNTFQSCSSEGRVVATGSFAAAGMHVVLVEAYFVAFEL